MSFAYDQYFWLLSTVIPNSHYRELVLSLYVVQVCMLSHWNMRWPWVKNSLLRLCSPGLTSLMTPPTCLVNRKITKTVGPQSRSGVLKKKRSIHIHGEYRILFLNIFFFFFVYVCKTRCYNIVYISGFVTSCPHIE